VFGSIKKKLAHKKYESVPHKDRTVTKGRKKAKKKKGGGQPPMAAFDGC
jgi:hypothetical protein